MRKYTPRLLLLTMLILLLSAGSALAATGTIAGSVVNIRGGPGTSHIKVGAVTQGARVEVINQSQGWYQIRFAGNRTGWVAGDLINVPSSTISESAPAAAPAQSASSSSNTKPTTARALEVTGSVVNLRQGPGTTHPVVGKVAQGTRLSVLGSTSGWYQVTAPNGVQGYITTAYVKAVSAGSQSSPSDPVTAPSESSSSVSESASSEIRSGEVTGRVVNLRFGPGTTYPRIGQVKQGDNLQIFNSSGDWYLVKSDGGKQGWVAGSLIKVGPAPQAAAPAPQPESIVSPPTPVVPVPEPSAPVPSPTPTPAAPEPPDAVKPGLNLPAPPPPPPPPQPDLYPEVPEPPSPSRGDSERSTEPPEQKTTDPTLIREGYLRSISEVVAGDVQIISIKNSVAASYEGEKTGNVYTLTLQGIERGATRSMELKGRGAHQVELKTISGEVPSTVLTFDLLNPCIVGITPSDRGKTINLYFRVTDKQQRTGEPLVVLDPGHGGSKPGAIGLAGNREKTINLAIAREVGRLLEQEKIEVTYTRTDDTHVELLERCEIANAAEADLFVSIHCNGNTNRDIQGTTTYYYAPADNPVLSGQAKTRARLASCLQKSVVGALGRQDKGIRQDNLVVLRETVIPAALVEVLYLSNPQEEALLAMPATQKTAAEAIARGIQDYLRQVGRL
ncbi:MAG: N-acetylmuramoyl-L-alanine amidase [Syntrophomonadaceae bacterium]|jgi:N-acetylmuramoyl-L-alanine amidase|nr:N-acetylmuramoyl-L-alanine amidase [Syntrophomonadaceae bacterium]